MREVVRGEAGDMGVRWQGGDADAVVPFDLADGGPHHVDQRHGPGVLLPVLRAGEDEEVLAVPAHDGGEVVELEERAEALGVLLALLQPLDDAELAFHEGEGAQGEVDEGAVDGAAGLLQPAGGRLEFLAQALPLVGHALALLDEVLAVGLQGADAFLEGDGVRVQGVDGTDDLRELVVAAGELDRLLPRRVAGQPRGALAQDGERAGEAAGERGGDGDGEQDERAEDGDADLQRGDVLVAEVFEVLAAALVEEDSAPRIASTRADRAVSSLVALVLSSLSEKVGWSVRRVRYFSALATSGPVTVVS